MPTRRRRWRCSTLEAASKWAISPTVPAQPLQEGYRNTLLRLQGQTTPREGAVVMHRLPTGQWIVSGRIVGEGLALRETLERSLLIALVVAGLLGLACGAILANYVGRRIGDIAAVADRIGARDLSQRVPLSGAGTRSTGWGNRSTPCSTGSAG